MIQTLLIANRAEIAHRVIRTARALGLRTVALASQADRLLPYVAAADTAVVWSGPSDATATYLDGERVLEAARASGADAIHPGYGFLSENAAFAERVIAAGLTWVGPPPAAMRAMGDKASARRVAVAHGVPVVPGFDASQAVADLERAAAEIGFPVMIKAVAGGGGRGMRRVDVAADLAEALASAKREALTSFGDDQVILERYVERPRHVEVQVMCDRQGGALFLGERECSIQRRHQKIVEEAPSPAVDSALRAQMGEAAVRVARAVGYEGAGTVEFLLDGVHGSFHFLEMNTRLQVEHPVTEAITGLDLVELQLRVAMGEPLPLTQADVTLTGHAIEVRLVAEDPMRDFLPATGTLHRLDLPSSDGVRVDAGFTAGDAVSPHYDALLAKLIASGPDRATATRRLLRLVERAWAPGVVTNLPLLRQILAHPMWRSADLDTQFLARAGLPMAPPLNIELGATAAAVLGLEQRRRNQPGPPGFRIGGTVASSQRWRSGAAEVTTHTTPNASGATVRVVGVDGVASTRDVVVERWNGDQLDVVLDGLRKRWRVAWITSASRHTSVDDGDLVYVHLGDGEAFVQCVPRHPLHAAAAAEPGRCTAPTPGKVTAVWAVVGERVDAGQRLITIEAMKMEHAVLAPEAGRVAEVRVAAGESVDEGTLLVRLEPTE